MKQERQHKDPSPWSEKKQEDLHRDVQKTWKDVLIEQYLLYHEFLATTTVIFCVIAWGFCLWQREQLADMEQQWAKDMLYQEEVEMFIVDFEKEEDVEELLPPEAPITFPILLNTATMEELMALPNLGEQRAMDIIDYREAQGGFTSLEELMNISGIGEAYFASFCDLLLLE